MSRRAAIVLLFLFTVLLAGEAQAQRRGLLRRLFRPRCRPIQSQVCRTCPPMRLGEICPQTELGRLLDEEDECLAILYYCEECDDNFLTVEMPCDQETGSCAMPGSCAPGSSTGPVPTTVTSDRDPPRGPRRYNRAMARSGLMNVDEFRPGTGITPNSRRVYLQRGGNRRDVILVRMRYNGRWVGVGYEVGGSQATERIIVTSPLTTEAKSYWVKDSSGYWYVVYLASSLRP